MLGKAGSKARVVPLEEALKYQNFVRALDAFGRDEAPRSECISLINDFVDTWTAHGFSRCYRARGWWRRGLWVVTCLALLGLCTFLCTNVVLNYVATPKNVRVKVIQDTKAEFPAVSLCNLNPLATKGRLLPKESLWRALADLEEEFSEGVGCDGLAYSIVPNSSLDASSPQDYDYADFYDYAVDDPDNATARDYRDYTDGGNRDTEGNSGLGQQRAVPLKRLYVGPFVTREFPDFTQARMSQSRGNEGGSPSKAGARSEAEIENLRLQCSKYYKFLKIINSEDKTLSDWGAERKDCPDKNFKEEVQWNPICKGEVFKDSYGNYTRTLNPYIEIEQRSSNGSVLVCVLCSAINCYNCKLDCIDKSEMEKATSNEISKEKLKMMFQRSYAADLSDIIGYFTPTKKELHEYAITAKDFITTCSYNGLPCFSKNFVVWPSDKFGQCYSFNLRRKLKGNQFREPRTSRVTGPGSGLRLTLNINTANYLSLLSPEVGVRVIIHDPRSIPFPEGEGFNIPAGASSSIRIFKKVFQYLIDSEGSCYKNSPNENIHTLEMCRKWCLEQQYWKECGCYMGKSPAYDRMDNFNQRPSQYCSPFNVTQKMCMDIVEYEFQENVKNCNCVPPCTDIHFTEQIITMQPNTKFYTAVKNIKGQYTGEDICTGARNSTVRLHLYLDSMAYELIEEQASYTWDLLLCNVGGNLGLFIGVSLVSVVELLELMFELISIYIQRLLSKSTPS